MTEFTTISFNYRRCRKEVLELRDLLAARPTLGEKRDLLPFFRKRPYLSAFCGLYNPSLRRFDRVAWEYDLFGNFFCDIVAGEVGGKAYTFIELEDASPLSVFKKHGAKTTREWSPRIDRGYSQIIDWFYSLNDRANSEEFEARFGARPIEYTAVLVAGRNQYLDRGELLRLAWRREHVVVHSKKIHCVTYDQLVDDLLSSLAGVLGPPPKGQRRTKGRGRGSKR
jgi:hypothetical protein